MASVAGKYFKFKWNDKFIKCQGDVEFNFDNTFEEEEACKPTGTTEVGMFVERTLSSQDWSVSVNTKAFLDALAGAELTILDLTAANSTGNVYGEGEFATTPGQSHGGANDLVISGNMVLSSGSLSGVLQGRASSTVEFLGNGPYTQVLVPVV